MSRRKYTEKQIVDALQQVEAGAATIDDVCRRMGIHSRTFYKWRDKFGAMTVDEAVRLRQLEEENRRLRHAVADLTLDNQALRSIVSKKF